MTNKWIEHVKDWSKLHNMKYNKALKDPDCKEQYKKQSGKGLYPSALPGKGLVGNVINVAKSKAKKYVKDKIKDRLNNVVNNSVDNVIGMGVVDKKQHKKMK